MPSFTVHDSEPTETQTGSDCLRVLLVEDVPGDARLVREYLRDIEVRNLQVEHVESLAEAACACDNVRYDVILLDLGLPDSVGIETLRRARAFAGDSAIVVMTGLRERDLPEQSVRNSAQEYLVKDDLNSEHLGRSIRQALGRQRRESELRRRFAAATEGEAALRELIANDADALLVSDERGKVLFQNPSALELFGTEEGDSVSARLGLKLEAGQWIDCELSPRRTVELRTSGIRWRGEPALLITGRDVSARKLAELELARINDDLRDTNRDLHRLASVDPLTGLINRRALERALEGEQSRAARSATRLVALMIDCDDFKRINDVHGHAVGDRVLIEVSARLRRGLRPSDHIARVGGDEFLVIIHELNHGEGTRVAERLRRRVSCAPIEAEGSSVNVTISIAVSNVPADALTIDALFASTSGALHQGKRSGKDQVVADAEVAPVAAAPASADHCTVFTQAIVAVASGRPLAWEIAAHGMWSGMRLPGDLNLLSLPAERRAELDLAGAETCIARARELGQPDRMHVNVMLGTIARAPEPLWQQLLDSMGSVVCVELRAIELLEDAPRTLARIAELRRRGVKLALDGCASNPIGLLVELELDWIKCDTALVRGLAKRKNSRDQLERLARMARAAGAQLIADGCDADDDLAAVRELGIQHAQGMLWGEWRELAPGAK